MFSVVDDDAEAFFSVAFLPGDVAEGDFVVIHGMGAYSTVTNTRFNGFGELSVATVLSQRI